MRPLRLLLTFTTTFVALTLLLYLVFVPQPQGETRHVPGPGPRPVPARKSKFKTLLSFTSPASLFPPSAIISLTDDNSTFFLARPAAFGPLLPSDGLSGPLWIGSGFENEALGRGELGCSDVPGWSDDTDTASTRIAKTRRHGRRDNTVTQLTQRSWFTRSPREFDQTDGTDDYLHLPLAAALASTSRSNKFTEHADIQSLQESAEIAGKVVLLKRGGCGFLEKVKWAQKRGGVALIVGDDVRGGSLIQMHAYGDTSNITIPALFTSHTTAHLLSSLLPSGGSLESLSADDIAKAVGTKSSDVGNKYTGNKRRNNGVLQTGATALRPVSSGKIPKQRGATERPRWYRSVLRTIGLGQSSRTRYTKASRKAPVNEDLDWVRVEDWDGEDSIQQHGKPSVTSRPTPTVTPPLDDFIIGEQDWRDPDLLPERTSTTARPLKSGITEDKSGNPLKGENDSKPKHKGWFSAWRSDEDESEAIESGLQQTDKDDASARISTSKSQSSNGGGSDTPEQHEGLWVTLTPTNMSSSPILDTLLVLVVSPLVTLTVVYALLLLRSRIRRRRWRAPKSVVERLPVRTYHTISDTPSPAATPATSSPTTPLLQRTHSRPTSSVTRSQSLTVPDTPATSSSLRQGEATEEEKREAGLAEWRRRYGGRQKECVVCLDEYVDGVSKVMSLPCGHEFHADCM
jgi:hypothetical protein